MRGAARNLAAALEEKDTFNEARLARAIERLIARARGSEALAVIISAIRERSSKQLRLQLDESITATAERSALTGNRLDLLASRTVARLEDGSSLTEESFAHYWAKELISHFVLEARGGVLELLGAERFAASEQRTSELIAPVVEILAKQVLANPRAQRIDLGFGDDIASAGEQLLGDIS